MTITYQNNTIFQLETNKSIYIIISLSSLLIIYSVIKICSKYVKLSCKKQVNINTLTTTTININRNDNHNIDTNNLLDDEELPSYSEAVKE